MGRTGKEQNVQKLPYAGADWLGKSVGLSRIPCVCEVTGVGSAPTEPEYQTQADSLGIKKADC